MQRSIFLKKNNNYFNNNVCLVENQMSLFQFSDRMAELEQENALLVSQIEEMANERAERDAIIEEFGSAVEARIVEWKVLHINILLIRFVNNQ